MSIRERLGRSKVLAWGLTYLAAAWVVWQALGEFGPRWGLSDADLRAADLVLIWGFAVSVVLAWHHGERGRQRPTWSEAGVLFLVTLGAAIAIPSVRQGTEVRRAIAPGDAVGVAVLPLDHRSGLDEDGWFTEAIQDQLINELGKGGELVVPSRTATRRYGDQSLSIREIGSQLRVDYLLEGAVQRGGQRLLISAALVSVASGERVWSEDFERAYSPNDVFGVQREIAVAVSQEVLGRLAPPSAALNVAPTASTTAMELVFRANLLWDDLGELEQAEELYAAAVEDDPNYVDAWAELARTRAFLLSLRRQLNWRGPAREALSRAEVLDASAPSVLTARGYVEYYLDRDYEAAVATLRRAAELRPNDAQIRLVLAALLRRLGRLTEAITVGEQALRVEPRSSVLLHGLVDHHELVGDRERSRLFLERWLTVDPENDDARRHEAWYRLRDGDVDGMLRQLEQAGVSGYELIRDWTPLYYAEDFQADFDRWLDSEGGPNRLFRLGQLAYLMGSEGTRRAYGDSLRVQAEAELADLEGLEFGPWQWPVSSQRAQLARAYSLLGQYDAMSEVAHQALAEFSPSNDVVDRARVAEYLLGAYSVAEDWDPALEMAGLILELDWVTHAQLAVDPALRPIWDEPRFVELATR